MHKLGFKVVDQIYYALDDNFPGHHDYEPFLIQGMAGGSSEWHKANLKSDGGILAVPSLHQMYENGIFDLMKNSGLLVCDDTGIDPTTSRYNALFVCVSLGFAATTCDAMRFSWVKGLYAQWCNYNSVHPVDFEVFHFTGISFQTDFEAYVSKKVQKPFLNS